MTQEISMSLILFLINVFFFDNFNKNLNNSIKNYLVIAFISLVCINILLEVSNAIVGALVTFKCIKSSDLDDLLVKASAESNNNTSKLEQIDSIQQELNQSGKSVKNQIEIQDKLYDDVNLKEKRNRLSRRPSIDVKAILESKIEKMGSVHYSINKNISGPKKNRRNKIHPETLLHKKKTGGFTFVTNQESLKNQSKVSKLMENSNERLQLGSETGVIRRRTKLIDAIENYKNKKIENLDEDAKRQDYTPTNSKEIGLIGEERNKILDDFGLNKIEDELNNSKNKSEKNSQSNPLETKKKKFNFEPQNVNEVRANKKISIAVDRKFKFTASSPSISNNALRLLNSKQKSLFKKNVGISHTEEKNNFLENKNLEGGNINLDQIERINEAGSGDEDINISKHNLKRFKSGVDQNI